MNRHLASDDQVATVIFSNTEGDVEVVPLVAEKQCSMCRIPPNSEEHFG